MRDTGLVRVELQSSRFDQLTELGQRRFGLFPGTAENHHVVGVANKREPCLPHGHIDRMEVHVRQKRTDDRPLWRSRFRQPQLHLLQNPLMQICLDQIEHSAIGDLLRHFVHQALFGDRVEVLS